MELPKLTNLDIQGKRILLRLDLDCEPNPNELRIKASEETLDYLKENGASEITIIAHKGRPEGKVVEELRLSPFQSIFDKWGAKVFENLRFDSGEESNDPEYAKKLAQMGDIFVNEAFASSHRSHASIVGIPKIIPSAFGLRFVSEVENLSRVFENPKRPVLFVIGGSKKDKPKYIESLKEMADLILIGGKLPEYYGDSALESIRLQKKDKKLLIGNLVQDKEDITLNSIEVFEKEIKSAGTIVLAGPMGRYETPGHMQGTERVFKAVSSSSAFKITGGGDSLVVISKLNLVDKFNWVSVGGGAMLEFLSKKTLPGIEAINNSF